MKKFEEGYKEFSKSITTDMEVGLRDLVPNLTEDDLKPDTEGQDFVIDADPATNPTAKQARTFTLETLQHLVNVQLRRSEVQARLTREEEKVKVLEAKVAELEKWRPDIEERIAARWKFSDKKRQELWKQIDENRLYSEENFERVDKDQESNLKRFEQIDLTL